MPCDLYYISNDQKADSGHSQFLEFTAHGRYSNLRSSSAIKQSPGLFSAPATYVIGEVLSQHRFSALPMPTITTKEIFQLGRDCTSLGNVCKDSKSNVYYWSSVTQMQYQISFSGDWARPNNRGSHPSLQDEEGEASTFALLEYIETKSVAYILCYLTVRTTVLWKARLVARQSTSMQMGHWTLLAYRRYRSICRKAVLALRVLSLLMGNALLVTTTEKGTGN